MHTHGLGLHAEEELPLGENGRPAYTEAMQHLLTLLAEKWRKEPEAERQLTAVARMLYFAPDDALNAVADELRDHPPRRVDRHPLRIRTLLKDQVLAVMKTNGELSQLLANRRKDRKASQRRRRVRL